MLAACGGPQYKTVYDVTPSASSNGQACAQGCDISRAACEKQCRIGVESCQRDYGGSYIGLGGGSRSGVGIGAGHVFPFGPDWGSGRNCSVQSCTADCMKTFKSCIPACGGQIQERKECVSNCEPLPAPR